MNYKWISNIVIGLIETYGTNDVYLLCNFLNIEIMELNSIYKDKSFFLCNKYGDRYIFIKSNIESNEKQVLIAHELGHALLHANFDISHYCQETSNKENLEFQADYFASQLLLSAI